MSSSSATRTNLHDILPALHHALSGATGTAIATCTTYPLSLVLTRLQAQVTSNQRQLAREGVLSPDEKYEGITDAFSRICAGVEGEEAGEGWKALYTGLTQDVTKSVLDSFLFFLFYELFQSRLRGPRSSRDRSQKGPGVLGELAVGVAAGACSRALTTPIATIVARKQTAALVADPTTQDADHDLRSVRGIAAAIRREKGLAGFWSGYSASLVLTLNPSLTFFLQEFLTRALVPGDRWDEPGAGLTFLLAAVSKAVASSVTYPFQIAKSRLQVSTVAPPTSTTTTTAEPEGGKPEVVVEEEEDSSSAASPTTTTQDVGKQVEAKLDAARAAAQKLARRSVFGTLLAIARDEGVAALYDGLPGELLKGFFGHGTTMVAKGVVHKLLFKLYLFLAGMLRETQLRGGGKRTRKSSRLYDDDDHEEEEAAMQYLPRSLHFRTDFSSISSRLTIDRGEEDSTSSGWRPWSWFHGGDGRGGGSNESDMAPDGDAAGFIINMTDRTHRKIR